MSKALTALRSKGRLRAEFSQKEQVTCLKGPTEKPKASFWTPTVSWEVMKFPEFQEKSF